MIIDSLSVFICSVSLRGGLISRIPIRGNYKAIDEKVYRLQCPPHVARISFILEIIIYSTIFAVSYWYLSISATTGTKVTYSVLDSSYTRTILSPRVLALIPLNIAPANLSSLVAHSILMMNV